MFNVEDQKIGIVVKDNPKKHLHRLYGMKISVGEKHSIVYVLDREIKGTRAILRRDRLRTVDMPRHARATARKWKVLRQNIEVIHEDSES